MVMNMERKLSNENYRYERKFIVPRQVSNQVISIVRNKMYFADLYEIRRVNSIYFDTDDLKFAKQNIDGITKRKKIRLRYYGDIDRFKNLFEEKIKVGDIGTKKIYKLNKTNDSIIHSLDFNKRRSNLPINIQNLLIQLKPIIFISYLRTYLTSTDKEFRATFDSDIECIPLNFNNISFSLMNKKLFKYPFNVLEIKYGTEDDNKLSSLMRSFPLRISKSSKYITGLNLIGRIDLI